MDMSVQLLPKDERKRKLLRELMLDTSRYIQGLVGLVAGAALEAGEGATASAVRASRASGSLGGEAFPDLTAFRRAAAEISDPGSRTIALSHEAMAWTALACYGATAARIAAKSIDDWALASQLERTAAELGETLQWHDNPRAAWMLENLRPYATAYYVQEDTPAHRFWAGVVDQVIEILLWISGQKEA